MAVINVEMLNSLSNDEFNKFLKNTSKESLQALFKVEDLQTDYNVEALKGKGVVDLDDVLLPSAEMLQLDVDEHLPKYNRDIILDYEAQIQINNYAKALLEGLIKRKDCDQIIRKFLFSNNKSGYIDDYRNQILLNKMIKKITEILIDRYMETKDKSDYDVIISFNSGTNDIIKAKDPVYDSESMMEFHNILAKINRVIDLSIKLNEKSNIRSLIDKMEDLDSDNLGEYMLLRIERLIQLSKNEKADAFENRDFFLESDQRKDGNHAMHYNRFYQLDNTFPETVDNVRDLASIFPGLRVFSHLNGDYEYQEKERFIRELDQRIEFKGVRFHDYEHEEFMENLEKEKQNGKKIMRYQRPRNNKALAFKKIYDIEDLSSYFLIDDSLDNLRAWKESGGIAIFFNRAEKKQDKSIGDDFIEITSLEPNRVILALIKNGAIKLKQKTYLK